MDLLREPHVSRVPHHISTGLFNSPFCRIIGMPHDHIKRALLIKPEPDYALMCAQRHNLLNAAANLSKMLRLSRWIG